MLGMVSEACGPALKALGQENATSEVILVCIAKLCVKTNKRHGNRNSAKITKRKLSLEVRSFVEDS